MCFLVLYYTGVTNSFFLFVCSENSKILHSFGDVTITCEGLQILTYARALRTLSSEGSLACDTYCDIRIYCSSVYNGHLRGPVTLAPNSECLAVELSLPVLTTYNRYVVAGSRTPNLPLAGESSNRLWHRGVKQI